MKSFAIFLLLIISCYLTGTAQSPAGKLFERVYMHFDKPWYQAGETIWYKAYLYGDNKPSLDCSEIYLQLTGPDGAVVYEHIRPIAGASAVGSMDLDTSLIAGVYTLRATTKTMASNANRDVYTKRIYIQDPAETIKPRKANNVSLRFFPESGYMIDRVNTQIAFKAIDEYGNPADVSGKIESADGNPVATFQSYHDGMGRFSLTPHVNKQFFAAFDYDGRHYRIPLPEAIEKGVCIKVTDVDSGKAFEIKRGRNNAIEYDSLHLAVMLLKDTVFHSLIDFGNAGAITGRLNTTKLPSGVLTFQVTSKFGVPLAERVAFVDNKEYSYTPEMKLIRRDSTAKGKNEIELHFPDKKQRSVSVSVIDFNFSRFTDIDHMFSRFYLEPYVRGYVHNAAYYFENADAKSKLALDNLLLTQGWTRFTINDNVKTATPIGDTGVYLSLRGMVYQDRRSNPQQGGTLSLQIVGEDSALQMFDLPVNSEGKFFVDSLIVFGSARVYHAYRDSKGKPIAVSVDYEEKQSALQYFSLMNAADSTSWPLPRNGAPFTAERTFMPIFDPLYKELSTVVFKARLRRSEEKTNDRYATGVFRSSGKLILDNINNPYNNPTLSVLDYVLTNIRTLGIYRDEGTLFNRKNFSLQTQRYWRVEVLMDEQVTSVATTQGITMANVAMVKFYEAGFVGVGSSAPGGAVAIYLRQGHDRSNIAKAEPAKSFAFKGYTISKEFYVPDYDKEANLSSRDIRSTLFWKSTLLSEDSTSLQFSFFNNDFSKKLYLQAEGFDASGKLIHLITPVGF